MFACRFLIFLSVLYHFSRTGGQQLLRQTAKAHVDHIAEGLKKTTAWRTVSGFHKTPGGEPFGQNAISVKNPTLAQMRRIIWPPDRRATRVGSQCCREQSEKQGGRTLTWFERLANAWIWGAFSATVPLNLVALLTNDHSWSGHWNQSSPIWDH